MFLPLFSVLFFLTPLLKKILTKIFPVSQQIKRASLVFVRRHLLHHDGRRLSKSSDQQVKGLFREPNIPLGAVSPSSSCWLEEGTHPTGCATSAASPGKLRGRGWGGRKEAGVRHPVRLTLSLTDQMALQTVKIGCCQHTHVSNRLDRISEDRP